MLNGAPEATRQIGDNCNTTQIERSGKYKTMPAIEQTARTFSTKVSGNKRIRSVNHPIINQARKRVARAKPEPRIESLAQLQRHPAIETIAGRDQLLELAARRIRTQVVDRRKRDFEHRCRRRTVQIHHRNRNAKLDHATDRVGIEELP